MAAASSMFMSLPPLSGIADALMAAATMKMDRQVLRGFLKNNILALLMGQEKRERRGK